MNMRTRMGLPGVRRASGFTLIELLVVIAIIALLTSILLPSLSGARRLAQATACAANSRSSAQGMAQYANDSNDWIIGSPNGSGAHIKGAVAHGATSQVWDFMGPLAKLSGIPLPENRTPRDVVARFNLVRNDLNQFYCRSNGFLATRFSGPNAGVGRMISYNTSRYMMFEWDESKTDGVYKYANVHEEKLPSRWSPRITRLGDTSKKVFMADGSRYATCNITPDYDLSATGSWGGAFSDAAPYSTFSRSWDRNALFGAAGCTFDARLYAFRHSLTSPREKAPADTLKANLVFFDGHAELMGDLQAANPWFWLPAGSKLETGSMYEDVKRHYQLTGASEIEINN
ncbi:MAG: type II secretion system protein [Phycisphaerae bacterium]